MLTSTPPPPEFVVRNIVAPRVRDGSMTLYLGAGFSIGNKTESGSTVPTTGALIERMLKAMGMPASTDGGSSLARVSTAARLRIPDFEKFFASQFRVRTAADWQIDAVRHRWRRIYTTNVDNILNVAVASIPASERREIDHQFFHFRDRKPAVLKELLIPVVSLHGHIERMGDGVVFDEFEYGGLTVRGSDWLTEAAVDLSGGPACVVGSRLAEPDLMAAVQRRNLAHASDGALRVDSFVVAPDVTEIDRIFFEAMGFEVIRLSAEAFFRYLRQALPDFESRKDFIVARYPHAIPKAARIEDQAWFGRSFRHVRSALEREKANTVVFSTYFDGWYPEWTFIANSVPAEFGALASVNREVQEFLRPQSSPPSSVLILAVTGGVGTGKTTLLRQVLRAAAENYDAVYDYEGQGAVDVDALWAVVKELRGPVVLGFDAAREHYYAINALADRHQVAGRQGRLVILIEDRSNQHERHKHQFTAAKPVVHELSEMTKRDARALHDALERQGALHELSRLPLDERLNRILHHDQWGGDLLVSLRELTRGKKFDLILLDELASITDPDAVVVYQFVCLVGLTGLGIPLGILSEVSRSRPSDILDFARGPLKGLIRYDDVDRVVRPRHARLAEFHYLKSVSSHPVRADQIRTLLVQLSAKFTVADMRFHPLESRIYREVISHDRLEKVLLPRSPNLVSEVFASVQDYFRADAIFWLQFGKHLHDRGNLADAEHCIRKGKSLFNTSTREDSFQINHALAHVLVDRYVKETPHDLSHYDEGVALFRAQVDERGAIDSYWYATYCEVLFSVLRAGLPPSPAAELDEVIRRGLQHHPGNERLTRTKRHWNRFRGTGAPSGPAT